LPGRGAGTTVRAGPCVDVFARFGVPPDARWMGPDGLHPSPAGQQEIARELLRTVSALP